MFRNGNRVTPTGPGTEAAAGQSIGKKPQWGWRETENNRCLVESTKYGVGTANPLAGLGCRKTSERTTKIAF